MKQLAFISGPVLGHAVRVFEIASRLQERYDVEITMVTPGDGRYLASRCAGRFPLEVLRVAQTPGAPPYRAMAEALDEVFSRNSYDAVLHDMCPVQWLAGTRFPDCHRINVTNVFLTRLANSDTFQTELFGRLHEEINAFRKARGLPAAKSAFDFYEADCVLLADPLSVTSLFRDVPGHYHHCGPITAPVAGTVPEEIAGLQAPLILSMGSTGVETLPEGLIPLLKSKSCSEAVIYAGDKAERYRADEIIDHAYDWLPLDAVLPGASAVVTQGGTGSTYQALNQGIPAFVYPSHRNQVLLGDFMEELGAGINVGSADWREKIEAADFRGMRERATVLSSREPSVSGAAKAAEIIASQIGLMD